jgi:hypothetical protein
VIFITAGVFHFFSAILCRCYSPSNGRVTQIQLAPDSER